LGKDGEGADFTLYGDTSGSYMKWDASANSLGFAGSAEIDIVVGSVDISSVGGIVMSGAMTDAILISGTCSDNGLEITGVCTGNAINIANTHNCVYIAPAAATTGGEYGLKISSTSTFSAAAAHKALLVEHAHTPSSAGTACPIAIVGKLTMGGDNTASNNYQGMGFGIQGQLHIATGSTFDGSTYGDTAGAVYCGVRAVCTDAGTSTYTKGKIACSFNDMQLTQNASSGANFKVYGIYNYVYNAAGNTNVDAVIAIDAHASLTAGTIEKGIQFISTAPVTTGISMESAMTTGISITGACSTAGITLADDITLDFGTSNDISISWTGQELLFEDTRTIDVGDGYNRTIHVGNTVTMTASRYGAISNYTTLAGTGGLDAYGAKFAMVQGTTKAVDGHYGAIMGEAKNACTSTSVASVLFLRWDNDAASGFGGVQHSFIRIQDNSSQTNCQALFDLYGMDATTGASATAITCAAGNATECSHVIRVVVGGVPYWLMMDSTAPA